MKKKILDSFYANEEAQLENKDKGNSLITIPMTMIYNKIHSKLKPICDKFGLSQAEIDMLVVLHIYKGGLTASEASDRMVITYGGISKIVKKLELKKLLYKKDSLEDKRSSLLYLEEEGVKIVEKCRPLFGETDQYFYDVLNEAEKNALEKAFKKILYSIAEKKQ